MQQFSCNLEPPDQGYLIINKGEGREGEGATTERGFWSITMWGTSYRDDSTL